MSQTKNHLKTDQITEFNTSSNGFHRITSSVTLYHVGHNRGMLSYLQLYANRLKSYL